MTDLSHLPEDVREALTRFTNYVQISIDGKRFASSDADTLRDYILRVTAERDGLAKRIFEAQAIGFERGRYALVKVE